MPSKKILVNDAKQLTAAIKSAKGGETILLVAGDYGAVTIKGRMLSNTVTIMSADPDHDAVFSGIRMHQSAGFRFEDVDVHRPLLAGKKDFTQAVYISASKNVTFLGVDFTGSMDGNAWNDGVALRVSDSSKIGLLDSTFEQWTNAAVFGKVDDLLVAGNTVTEVREGFNFASVNEVMIAQNRFLDFDPNYAAGDHSDAIQFWNNGSNVGSTNVTIRDNVIIPGENGVQGIFIRAEKPELRHSGFTIENNLYHGAARHGISADGVNDISIQGNTVTTSDISRLEAGINLSNVTGGTVQNNISPLLLYGNNNAGLTLTGNIDLYDTKTKAGIGLSEVFMPSSSEVFSETSYVSKVSAGFRAIDGIGAASFDVQVGTTLGSIHLAVQEVLF